MIECPKCHRTERQNRAGKTPSGSQRYRCMFCQIKHTPEPKAWAYPEEVRRKALQLYVDGMNLRRIARHLGIRVVGNRTQEILQEMVDDAPKAKRYYSDAFETYDHLWYHWGVYEVSEGKRDTYSVEADNAELRHCLARLARRSRCFSRCPKALKAALKLFMGHYTHHPRHKKLIQSTEKKQSQR